MGPEVLRRRVQQPVRVHHTDAAHVLLGGLHELGEYDAGGPGHEERGGRVDVHLLVSADLVVGRDGEVMGVVLTLSTPNTHFHF